MEGQHKQQTATTTRLKKEFVDVLSKDLKSILSEVAATGVSLRFPWVEDTKPQYAVPKQIPRILPKQQQTHKFRHKRPRPNHGRIAVPRMFGSTPTTVAPATTTTTTTTTLLPPRMPQQTAVPPMTNGRRLGERKRSMSRSGSGLPSGSEAEEMSQCDSESTSVTSVSELSFDLGRGSHTNWSGGALSRKPPTDLLEDSHVHVFVGQPKPRSLRDAFRIAVDLLLESYYQKRGYKPSPAEKRKHSTAIANEAKITNHHRDGRSLSRQSSAISERELMMQESIISFDGGGNPVVLSDDELQKLQKTAFCNRKEKILSFLDDPLSTDPVSRGQPLAHNREPPFTLQRIAEILEDPERFYTQTHKLCNSLEKLLLVSTTVTDFGGWYGGEEESIRSILEDRESTRHRSSSVTKMAGRDQQESPTSTKAVVHSNSIKTGKSEGEEVESSREVYDAAARASLRAKFDHTGFDPRLAADAKAISDGRTSPPPPNRTSSPTIQIPMATGFLRSRNSPHSSPTSPDGRLPPAFSFHTAAAAQSRASPAQSPMSHSPGAFGSAFTAVPVQQLLQMNHAAAVSSLPTREAETSSGAEQLMRDAETESKSPASLSDADDSDMSFDDSASDRSDGSDAGQPDSTTASLAAALNRAHQRLHQQNRVLSQLQGGEGYVERVGMSQHQPSNVSSNEDPDASGQGETSGRGEE